MIPSPESRYRLTVRFAIAVVTATFLTFCPVPAQAWPKCVQQLFTGWAQWLRGPVVERYENFDPVTRLYRVRWDRKAGDLATTQLLLRSGVPVEGGYNPSFGYDINPSAFPLRSAIRTRLDGRGYLDPRFVKPGHYIYVIGENDDFILGKRKSRYPHPALLGGLDPKAKAAGHLEVGEALTIRWADNLTGHFDNTDDVLDDVVWPWLQRLPPGICDEAFEFRRHRIGPNGQPHVVREPPRS